ncbi:MAG: ABC transporter permease [Trueperaceae bacterium]
MISYILKRAITMVFTIVIVSMVSFAIIQLPPGDYVTKLMAQIAGTGANIDPRLEAEMRMQYGLDQPMYVQYFKWVGNLFQGEFGFSYLYDEDAGRIIRDRLPVTLIISVTTLLFVWFIAVPVGIYSAMKKYSPGDYSVSFLTFLGMSIPDFLLAIMVMFFMYRYFGQSVTGLFSPEYDSAPWSFSRVLDLMKHLWVPVLIAGANNVASLIRIMRSNLLDELNKPYVETARAKGLSEARLLWKYPVRHAINPLVSTIGWVLPGLIASEVLVANVLNLPTTGPVFLQALQGQDQYLAAGFILLLSALTVIGTFISDLLLAWLDPRIRLE